MDEPTTAMRGFVLGDVIRREPEDGTWAEPGMALWPGVPVGDGGTRDLLDAGSLGVTADGEDPAIGASVDNALVDLGRRRLTGTKPSSSLSADSRRTDNDKDDNDNVNVINYS